jgi:uncharacterized protein
MRLISKRRLMLTRTLAALTSFTIVAACHGPSGSAPQVIAIPASFNADAARPGQMTVTGTAVLEVSPDCADLTITLGIDAPRPRAATTQVETEQRTLIDSLAKLGVAEGDLKLSSLSLEPLYESHPDGSTRLVNYRAEITVTATTHDFAKISGIMEAGADAGATHMSSQFRRADLPTLKKQVRDMALAAARDKAKQTAAGLGFKLGRVMSVSENANGTMWNSPYFPQSANANEVHSAGGSVGATLQPLTLDITVGYELAQDS